MGAHRFPGLPQASKPDKPQITQISEETENQGLDMTSARIHLYKDEVESNSTHLLFSV
jgi:hypothetical protein